MANQVAYGFTGLQDIFDNRVVDTNVTIIDAAIQASLTEHNRQLDALYGLFASQTTDFQLRYQTPTIGRLQPGDELSRALPVRRAGHYDVAFPLQNGQDSLGLTYEASVKITVQELGRRVADMLQRDIRWMRDHLLGALLDNTAWTFTDDQHGALTIEPLADGGAELYQILSGSDAGAVDTHQIAQSAAVADATNPYPVIHDEMLEHPENGGEVISLIATAQVATTRALANFYPISDQNVAPGNASDTLTGSLSVPVPGRVIGYTDEVWIVHWRHLPSGYIISTTTEGEKALRRREHAEAQLQGFKLDAERNNYPYYEQQWTRRAGFGAFNRVGAMVTFVGAGDTVYDIPTGFTTPMP